ncbi:hypothetical protein PR202_ga14944 [Eleusine coracana subsp. coracana]|uniref:Lipoxygenase domain-containing protein n=1 Tax=Eleusine coracana subsp. coracana TaxID=191504 RepID=A0AAV5CIW6_ELECO|nr:hypothetical protein PR202_ga14944 [Eleusine coracana subsp. coracana]
MPVENEQLDMAGSRWTRSKLLLDTIPSQYQSLTVMTILNLLSTHSPDEEYMGTHVEPACTAEGEVNAAYNKSRRRMLDIREHINKWNEDRALTLVQNNHAMMLGPFSPVAMDTKTITRKS